MPINEVDFCSLVASEVNSLIRQNPDLSPLHEVRIERYGKGAGRRKRKGLGFYDRNGKLLLCGEVKLPGTPEGRSPYGDKLCSDAAAKASDAGIRFFFTWNVNAFVLWDHSLCERPLLERRVAGWPLGRDLVNPEEVAREDNLTFIKTHFLPDLLRNLADIVSGRRRDWSMPPDDIFIQLLKVTWIGPSS